jgi:signal transduction histidine kinase
MEGPSPEILGALGGMFAENPDAIRLVGQGGEVLLRNVAAMDFPAEGLGHLCAEERRGRDVSCPACQLVASFREGSHRRWNVAAPAPGKPDSKRYYEVTLCPVRNAGGEVVAVIEIVRDTTATLGLEQFLIRTAESQDEEILKRTMEAGTLIQTADSLREELGALRDMETEIVYRDRLVALGHLVAGLAHEIHTPLGAVVSSADLLRRRLDRLAGEPASAETVLPDFRESVSVIAEGARRIEGVVKSLRLFSRVDEAPLKEVDLHEGLDSTLELLRYRIGETIQVVKEYGRLPPVACRPDALNQVFLNLLVNAAQAIEGDGEIRVRTRRDGESAVVEIEDTGVGISPDVLPRIFDLGFSTRGRGRGSGIGLALSRRIVEDHGGSIEASSTVGKGSRFTLRLPLGAAETR